MVECVYYYYNTLQLIWHFAVPLFVFLGKAPGPSFFVPVYAYEILSSILYLKIQTTGIITLYA